MVRSSLRMASSRMQFLLTSSSLAEQCAMVAAQQLEPPAAFGVWTTRSSPALLKHTDGFKKCSLQCVV
jgi:hypothetical protein